MTVPVDLEVWKAVPGFGSYEVSSEGRVRSYKWGRPKILRPSKAWDGRSQVTLFEVGSTRTILVCRLVLLAFVGPAPLGYQCAHLDGDKHHNNVRNLKWATRRENASHRLVHDTHVRGSRSTLSKLTPEQADEIRAADPRSLRKLAARIGVSHACVWDVHRGITYKPDPTPEEIARIRALMLPSIAEGSNG